MLGRVWRVEAEIQQDLEQEEKSHGESPSCLTTEKYIDRGLAETYQREGRPIRVNVTFKSRFWNT